MGVNDYFADVLILHTQKWYFILFLQYKWACTTKTHINMFIRGKNGVDLHLLYCNKRRILSQVTLALYAGGEYEFYKTKYNAFDDQHSILGSVVRINFCKYRNRDFPRRSYVSSRGRLGN